MVVHEIMAHMKVKEIFAVSGGSLGGNRVNEKFVELLKELLGDEFIDEFKKEFPKQWLNFMIKFERCKKMIEHDRRHPP